MNWLNISRSWETQNSSSCWGFDRFPTTTGVSQDVSSRPASVVCSLPTSHQRNNHTANRCSFSFWDGKDDQPASPDMHWLGMTASVRRLVKICEVCQTAKHEGKRRLLVDTGYMHNFLGKEQSWTDLDHFDDNEREQVDTGADQPLARCQVALAVSWTEP